MKAPTTLAKLLIIAVVTGAATTGCASRGTSPFREVGSHQQTAVYIHNNNWSDVTVYLLHAGGGTPVRIRRVGSLTTEGIPLRGRIKRELQAHGRLQFLIKPTRKGCIANSTNHLCWLP